MPEKRGGYCNDNPSCVPGISRCCAGYTGPVDAQSRAAARDLSAAAAFGTVPNAMLVAPLKGIKSAKEPAERGKFGNLTARRADDPGSRVCQLRLQLLDGNPGPVEDTT